MKSKLLRVAILLGVAGTAAIPFASLSRPLHVASDGSYIVVDSPIKNVTVRCTVTQAPVSYKITNTASFPVKIKSVKPECGCTIVKNYTPVIAPGATTSLDILFDSTGYLGIADKHVVLQLEPSRLGTLTLEFVAKIIRPIQVSPRTLVWRAGEPLDEKSALVEICPDIRFKSLVCDQENSNFYHSLKQVDPHTFELYLKPGDTSAARTTAFALRAVLLDGTTTTIICYGVVATKPGEPIPHS